jgi:transposase InsO family protein
MTLLHLVEFYLFFVSIPLGQGHEVYLMTMVDRATSCVFGWAVGEARTEAVLQALVDAAPQAALYYSDAFATYAALVC